MVALIFRLLIINQSIYGHQIAVAMPEDASIKNPKFNYEFQ